MNSLQKFGNTIKSLRIAAGLSVPDLAAKISKATSIVDRIEAGFQLPTPNTLAKIADVLGCKVEDLEIDGPVPDSLNPQMFSVQWMEDGQRMSKFMTQEEFDIKFKGDN